MAERYRVTSRDAERERLRALTRQGNRAARMVRRAQILLLADDGKTDEATAAALHSGLSTAARGRPEAEPEAARIRGRAGLHQAVCHFTADTGLSRRKRDRAIGANAGIPGRLTA